MSGLISNIDIIDGSCTYQLNLSHGDIFLLLHILLIF